MKNIKIIISFLFITAVVLSCRDADKDPLGFDKLTNGAFMRQIELVSGSFDLFNFSEAEFVITLEAEDANGGDLFASYDIYVAFIDNTPIGEDTFNIAEVFVKTIDASAFTKDPESGLPRATITVTSAEAMAVLGITAVDLDGGDTFDFRGEMHLSDDRSFTITSTGPNIAGGEFYNSPFFNRVAVVCEFNPEFYTGDYMLLQTAGPSDPFFGGDRFMNGVVTLSVGETSTQRVFDLTYVTFTGIAFTVNLVCGNVVIPFQGSGIGCGGPGMNWISDSADQATFSITDDSILVITFIENIDGECGLPAEPGTQITLTKM